MTTMISEPATIAARRPARPLPSLAAALEAHAIAAAIAPFAARVSTPDACPRAGPACAQLMAASRYVLRQEPLASADHQTIAAWAAPALDCVLGGEFTLPL